MLTLCCCSWTDTDKLKLLAISAAVVTLINMSVFALHLMSSLISSVQGLSVSSFVKTLQVIGNGSFGVVYQARLIDSQEMVAIKKVLQDKRFKVIAPHVLFSVVI